MSPSTVLDTKLAVVDSIVLTEYWPQRHHHALPCTLDASLVSVVDMQVAKLVVLQRTRNTDRERFLLSGQVSDLQCCIPLRGAVLQQNVEALIPFLQLGFC